MHSTLHKLVSILCLTLLLFLVGCSTDKPDENSQPVESNLTSTEATENESGTGFIVDKIVYENESVVLICKRIISTGIEFECTNKSDEDISLYLTIGLDGIVTDLWCDGYDTEISAGKTKSFMMNGSFDAIEHKLMSVNCIVFADSNNYEFDVCDMELGGERNSGELPSGETVYSTDNLVVEYLGADAQGVNYKVINNRVSSIIFGADTFKINDDDTDYAMSVTTIPGHTQGIYTVDILGYNENYFSSELKSFEGILDAHIDGEGVVDRFSVSYGESELTKPEATEPEQTTSAVYDAYITATTLTKANLKKENSTLGTKYYYNNDLPLLSEDVEWIENPINKEGTVNQGAIYRKLAKLLDGYAIHMNNGSSYSKYIFGDSVSTDEFGQYATIVSEFITNEDSLYHILKKFESLECVDGNFDYANNSWSFNIPDLTQCAEEMQISEEMLGYIFAMLDEYAPSITFDGNGCIFEFESMFDFGFEEQVVAPISKEDFLAEIPVGSNAVNIYDNMISDGYASYYCYYDSSADPSKDGVIQTYRDIHLGDSKATVISKYGEANSNAFIMQSNALYQDLLEYSPAEAGIMRSQCSTYIAYAYQNLGAIEFYFDENGCLSWIVFYAY